ncbi:alpha-L-rhamnosidase [Flavobacterium agrisoli]|uniref:alpha-L-rhamnosidase n=1 Tax=Flavobacterium agrisoli TaxID=2793066 RepID=A0A934PMG2_9FLAO|nr:alpha-L-rhamnosidase [Flavobacterium agrisoli]MBK0370901.1 family 78 glycoside hydrolase catalytic domain [Flavobacterium agrisoli]
MKKTSLYIFILIASLCFPLANAQNKISVTNLQCEKLNNPEGIDVLQPRLSWKIKSSENDVKQTAYQIIAASTLDKLNANSGDLWDSGKISSDNSINVKYAGKALEGKKEVFWKVKVWTNKGEAATTETAHFSTGILNYVDWRSTRWIGWDKVSPQDSITMHARLSARYLRKEIELKKAIRSAKVYMMGLGMYELYFNGNKIGNQVLAPVPTDYTKNVKYNVFDVTSHLKQGKNAIGTILGNGRFFTMRQDYKPYKIKNFGMPKMAMQLIVTYTDGSKETFKSDESWKLTTGGPILTNNEYDGEEYDARKELTSWNTVGFDDKNWKNATFVYDPGGFPEAQMTPNMKVMGEVKPISIKATPKGTYILDMGQNMVGWLQLKVQGKRGDSVKLKFAESLQKDGSLYIDNLRDALTTDIYTLKGGGQETWEPKFVYHGFRFVEISGFPGKPTLENFVGKVVYDEMKTIGTFESSNATMNQIFKNAWWGISGNYKGMPVDCPQRNERQPWLGDRTTGAYGESFLFDNQTLYAKWLDDIEYAQTQDGGIPDVAPAYWNYYGDNVTWPATYFTVADMLYNQFGNSKAIKKHYPSMKKWMDYMAQNYLENDLMTKDRYGDWCVPPESLELIHSKDSTRVTDGTLISTAYYIRLLQLMKKFAVISGANTSDIQQYEALAKKMKSALNAKFFNKEKNFYANNTVTANLLPLRFGLVPEELKEKVFANIVHEIEVTYKGHISTGVIGTQILMRTLTDFGRGDLAFKLASNKTYPSWGYMAENGATTIWELWNGNTADPKMNSQNHVMLLGDLLVWYYENMAGIKSSDSAPAFKEIIMKPDFNAGLTFVNASYESVYGLIKSNWKKNKKNLEWKITIPANSSAVVYLPTTNASSVTVNNQKLDKSSTSYKTENTNIVLKLASGSYVLNVK